MIRLNKVFIISILVSYGSTVFAQPDSLSLLYRKRQKTVIIASSVAYSASMVALASAWYSQYDSQPFRFFNDAHEWKQMDKAGHTFSAFQLTAISSATWQWSGLSKQKSDRIGALTSFGIMSSIEILDGFSAGYGASVTDVIANAAGNGLYWGQQALWKETRIYPKISFHRTHYAPLRPHTLGNGLAEEILKDYNGQTYWLSVDMDKFTRFPKWLNLAVGYGAEGMIYAHDISNLNAGYNPHRKLFVGVDFDLTAFKSRNKTLNTLIFIANMVRLPAPALQFSQGRAKGHWFYF
ncbi:MAG: DUF2279 domain-containing protein [Cyclobacteriaceae bacterium]|nr:DUF2279 domain-containing protein [Cyclobacteriaceae bacterium]